MLYTELSGSIAKSSMWRRLFVCCWFSSRPFCSSKYFHKRPREAYLRRLSRAHLLTFRPKLCSYCRPPKDDAASAQFDSLGETMFISTLMLTGGGGPDTDNLPWYTKAVVLLTSVFSVAMFAIPASMLTWGFEAEAERMAKQARKQALKRREKKRQSSEGGSQQFSCSSSSSSDYESDGGTTDEEYFQLISGLDPPDEDETPAKKILREKFEKADADRVSSTISE